MTLRMKIVSILVVGLLAFGQVGQIIAVDPKPPESMTYQGYLVDSNGVPLGNTAPANYDVIFRIYNAKSGGEPIWSEVQTITIDKGYLGLDYGNFGVLSIKAIQELGREKDAEVASLEKKNEQLESRVQSLESELSLLKAQLASKQNTESRLAKFEEIINNIDKGQ